MFPLTRGYQLLSINWEVPRWTDLMRLNLQFWLSWFASPSQARIKDEANQGNKLSLELLKVPHYNARTISRRTMKILVRKAGTWNEKWFFKIAKLTNWASFISIYGSLERQGVSYKNNQLPIPSSENVNINFNFILRPFGIWGWCRQEC